MREHRSGRRRLFNGARNATFVLGIGLLGGTLAVPASAGAAAGAVAAAPPAATQVAAPPVATVAAQLAAPRAAAVAAQLATPVQARQQRAASVLAEAQQHTGKPYVFGSAGPGAFDCSGYTRYVLRRALGVNLPHKADAQQRMGTAVSRDDAQPGDLIFFRNGSYAYHVAIYAGDGHMYDAPRPGKSVAKRKVWSNDYVVRRFV